jgi:hypothetical protein
MSFVGKFTLSASRDYFSAPCRGETNIRDPIKASRPSLLLPIGSKQSLQRKYSSESPKSEGPEKTRSVGWVDMGESLNVCMRSTSYPADPSTDQSSVDYLIQRLTAVQDPVNAVYIYDAIHVQDSLDA